MQKAQFFPETDKILGIERETSSQLTRLSVN